MASFKDITNLQSSFKQIKQQCFSRKDKCDCGENGFVHYHCSTVKKFPQFHPSWLPCMKSTLAFPGRGNFHDKVFNALFYKHKVISGSTTKLTCSMTKKGIAPFSSCRYFAD